MWGKKSVSSQATMNKHFFTVFNTMSIAILEFSTVPWEESKCKTREGSVVASITYSLFHNFIILVIS